MIRDVFGLIVLMAIGFVAIIIIYLFVRSFIQYMKDVVLQSKKRKIIKEK